MPEDHEITPAELDAASQGLEIRPGDIVLLRTGWARFYSDARRFVNETKCPGPGLDGARWLSARRIFAAGSDTVAFEKVPAPAMPVHVHLLVESGIHIIECLNLDALAAEGDPRVSLYRSPAQDSGSDRELRFVLWPWFANPALAHLLLAHQKLLHLLGDRHRKRIDEPHVLRHLEIRNLAAAKLADLLFRGLDRRC